MQVSLRRVPLFVLGLLLGGLINLGFLASPAAAAPEPCADLVVTSFTISPFYPTEGKVATVNVSIRNQGNCRSLSFVTQFKSSTTGFTGTGPSFSVEDGIPAFTTQSFSFPYTFPKAGDFTAQITVDSDNTAPETNESNNIEIRAVTVLEDLPDLVVEGVSFNPYYPVEGQSAQIVVRVRNDGSKDAGPFTVQWKANLIGNPGAGTQVPGLAAYSATDVYFNYTYPTKGNYTTEVTVDSSNTVVERNEDNNLFIRDTVVIEDKPDLEIEYISISQPVVAGQNADISIRVWNWGSKAAGPFTVQWKGNVVGPTGPSTQIPGLDPYTYVDVNFPYAFPNPGNFTTQATVDSDNTVEEANESNNLAIQDVTVEPDLPDLRVMSVSIVPIDPPGAPMPVEGKNARITIEIRNQGGKAANEFVVQWRSDQRAPVGPSIQFPGLAAYTSTTWEFVYAFPADGNFTTLTTVDSDNTVVESNENNNLFLQDITVLPDNIDLVITGFTITPQVTPPAPPTIPAPGYPNIPVAGLNSVIKIWVTNQGTKGAGPFVVQWKSDLRAPTGPSTHIPWLEAGETRVVEFIYAFPTAGNFTTQATVDSDRMVVEFNEDNNIEILPVTVQRAEIDLVITDFKVQPAPGVQASLPPNPVAGRLSLITIEVQNQGNFPAGDFAVEWKPTPLAADITSQVNGLEPGQKKVIRINYTYPFPGQFVTTATADSTRRVREINENNNTAQLAITVEPQLPDLVITQFFFTPADPVRGVQARVTIRVRNVGNSDAGPFTVSWVPAPRAPAFSRQVNGLTPHNTATINFDYTYAFAGTFDMTATADSTGRVRELNEENNSRTVSVNVVRDFVDLVIDRTVVTQGGAAPACVGEQAIGPTGEGLDAQGPVVINEVGEPQDVVQQGRPVYICVIVSNLGNTSSGNFVVSFNPDSTGLIVPSPGTLTKQIDNLGAESSKPVLFTFTYIQAGTYRTTTMADAFDRVRESNEANNLDIHHVVVEATGPDLTITSLTAAPDYYYYYYRAEATLPPFPNCDLREEHRTAGVEPQLEQDANTLVCIVVENKGNRPAGPFVVSWNPDTLGLITPSPSTLTTQVNGLDAGERTVVVFNFVYHDAGNFRTTANADAFNNVAELNESNNLSLLDVVVKPVGPDLTITQLSVGGGYEGDYTSGDSLVRDSIGCRRIDQETAAQSTSWVYEDTVIQVCITVENIGSRDAAQFVVEWNPDTRNLITPSPGTISKQVNGLAAGGRVDVLFYFIYTQDGDFRTVAKVDAFNVVEELNEANNLAIENVVVNPVGPDLVITEMIVGYGGDECEGRFCDTFIVLPSQGCQNRQIPSAAAAATTFIEQDTTIPVCITVYNQGDRPAGPFTVEWNPDTRNLITPSPATVTEEVPGLAPYSSVDVILYFVYTQAGTFRTVAKADAFNAVAELNEANNLKVVDVEVYPVGPDLVITGFTISPQQQEGRAGAASAAGIEPELTQGVPARISITVANYGNRAAGDFLVEWNPDTRNLITPSPGTLSKQVNGLSPWASTTVEFDFTYHAQGGFRTVAKVDALNAVAETNEANNLDILNVVVNPPYIDLQVTAFTVSPNPVVRGSKATASITVRNFGSYPSGAFFVQWVLDRDTCTQTTPVQPCTGPRVRVDGLQPFGQPGDTQTVTMESTYRVADTYISQAIVDSTNIVEEPGAEGNNRRNSATISVTPRQTQLRVTFENLNVFRAFTDGLDGDAEWWIFLFVVDPNHPDGYQLQDREDGSVEDGDNISLNKVFNVTLIESTPLILGAAAAEMDDFLGIITDGKFLGYVAQVWSPLDYKGLSGSITVNGVDGPCSNGACYNVRYKVEVISEPPALATELGAEELPAPKMVLPAGIMIPDNAKLPAGVQKNRSLYVPMMMK